MCVHEGGGGVTAVKLTVIRLSVAGRMCHWCRGVHVRVNVLLCWDLSFLISYLTFYYNYVQSFRLTLSLSLSVCLSLSLSVTAFTNSCWFSSRFRNNLWGYPAWSVICVCACVYSHAPAHVYVTSLWERERLRYEGGCTCVWICERQWYGVWVWVWRQTGWE